MQYSPWAILGAQKTAGLGVIQYLRKNDKVGRWHIKKHKWSREQSVSKGGLVVEQSFSVFKWLRASVLTTW